MQWLVWLGLGIALGLIELLTLDLTFLMLGAGALAAMLSAALGTPWWVQVVVFALASVLMLAAVRPWVLARLRIRGQAAPLTGAAALVGRSGQAISEVTNNAGQIKLAGEVWSARTGQVGIVLKTGASVLVTEIDGATAVVRAAETAAPQSSSQAAETAAPQSSSQAAPTDHLTQPNSSV
ncbi:MAG: NfeD family protein [Bifidobacteriaceae bacterium]|jgi:membrane protein implicated in regulation of membrane protease activity|nr:NfeD family protein [Bifidobacteriaceae bacterium]